MTREEFNRLESFFIEEVGDPKGFEIIDGSKKFILSAPHSVPQLRNGRIKLPEYRTGIMAIELSKRLSCPVIYKTRNLDDDANFDEVHPYREALKNYIVENNIEFLIDLHISRPDRDYDVDIGSGNGVNIFGRDDLVEKIASGFINYDYNTKVDFLYTGDYPYCVPGDIAKHTSTPSIMIEFNWNVMNSYDKMVKLISALESGIRSLKL